MLQFLLIEFQISIITGAIFVPNFRFRCFRLTKVIFVSGVTIFYLVSEKNMKTKIVLMFTHRFRPFSPLRSTDHQSDSSSTQDELKNETKQLSLHYLNLASLPQLQKAARQDWTTPTNQALHAYYAQVSIQSRKRKVTYQNSEVSTVQLSCSTVSGLFSVLSWCTDNGSVAHESALPIPRCSGTGCSCEAVPGLPS